MMINKKFIFIIVTLSLLVTPIISAYSYGWSGNQDPMMYLNNAWVLFILYFMFFFAIIFFTTNKSFKNPSISAVVALAMALFISMSLSQRGWLNPYFGGQAGAWALFAAALIAIGFSIKFSYETFGRIGAVATILIIWFAIHSTVETPQDILPQELLNETILNVYSFMGSFIGLFILLIISIVIIMARGNRKMIRSNDFLDSMFGRG